LSDSHENQPENGTRWTNADLPFGCRKDNVWRRTYIPTYITFVAGYRDPWTVGDDDAVTAMQKTWNKVYLNRSRMADIQHQVVVNNAVFSIVSMAVPSNCFANNDSRQISGFTNGVLGLDLQPCRSSTIFWKRQDLQQKTNEVNIACPY
jgi:hypothetical protein